MRSFTNFPDTWELWKMSNGNFQIKKNGVVVSRHALKYVAEAFFDAKAKEVMEQRIAEL